MRLDSKYSNNKIYSGIEHYDGNPLLSEDIHEYADTISEKNKFLLNNLVGSGILNDITISQNSLGVSLQGPAVLLVDGDIVLIHNSTGTALFPWEKINTNQYTNGYMCIVGWYQHLGSSSLLRDYGGVNNDIIGTGFADNVEEVNLSSRYQFRWDVVAVDRDRYINQGTFSISIPKRDQDGIHTNSEYIIVPTVKSEGIRIAGKDSHGIDYALSDIYIIPIIQYTYSNGTLSGLKPVHTIRAKGSKLIKSEEMPTGYIAEGTVWYNTTDKIFFRYILDEGFVPVSAKDSIKKSDSVTTIVKNRTSPENVLIDISTEYDSTKDIIQVYYEGLLLEEGIHYSINHTTRQVTLLGFTTEIGDRVLIRVLSIIGN